MGNIGPEQTVTTLEGEDLIRNRVRNFLLNFGIKMTDQLWATCKKYAVGVEAVDGVEVLKWQGCDEWAKAVDHLLEPGGSSVGDLTDEEFRIRVLGQEFFDRTKELSLPQLLEFVQAQVGMRDEHLIDCTAEPERSQVERVSIPYLDDFLFQADSQIPQFESCAAPGSKLNLVCHQLLVLYFAQFDSLKDSKLKEIARQFVFHHDSGKLFDYENGLHNRFGECMEQSLFQRINRQRKAEGKQTLDESTVNSVLLLTRMHHMVGSISQKLGDGVDSDLAPAATEWAEARKMIADWTMVKGYQRADHEVDDTLNPASVVYDSAEYELFQALIDYLNSELSENQLVLPSSDDELRQLIAQFGYPVIVDVPEFILLIQQLNHRDLLHILGLFTAADTAATDRGSRAERLQRVMISFPQLAVALINFIGNQPMEKKKIAEQN